MSALWREIEKRIDEHSYMDGIERTVDRVRASAEIFTPTRLVIEILQNVDLEILKPGKTVLDPAAGDGQFLVAAKWVKILRWGMAEENALSEIFGVDIMRDNVDLCRRRLGGGTIVMGNSLEPSLRLEGQTPEEYFLMQLLFPASPGSKTRKRRARSTVIAPNAQETLF